MGDQLSDVVTLRSCVLRVAADVEVKPGTIAKKHV
jgi:hypothetical protein